MISGVNALAQIVTLGAFAPTKDEPGLKIFFSANESPQ